jgi:pyruvate dehydrogenase complex dehydrogenase (E1) component
VAAHISSPCLARRVKWLVDSAALFDAYIIAAKLLFEDLPRVTDFLLRIAHHLHPVGHPTDGAADGKGLASYPHPWLMPGFWQFPTVSMGLTPMMAIAQARFMRYLDHRDILDTSGRKVWAFLGDGEMDEPESLGSLSLAARERLDNLIFVVNCNLQRLDGPVRGNGKIIQELEAVFRGAGWNVIKVIWGSNWYPLLARDSRGLLRQRMQEAVDGDFQQGNRQGQRLMQLLGSGTILREVIAAARLLEETSAWRPMCGAYRASPCYGVTA